MLFRLLITFLVFYSKGILSNEMQYVVKYRNCANDLCGDVSTNLVTSMANDRLLNEKRRTDFKEFESEIKKYLVEKRAQNILAIEKALEVFSSENISKKVLNSFVSNLVDQVKFENSKLQLPVYYNNFKDKVPLLFNDLELLTRDKIEIEAVCSSEACQREILDFFSINGIRNRLNAALLKTKNIKNFAALSLNCRPNWSKESFFEGDQKSLKKYEEGLENALDKFLNFARTMGVEFLERPQVELMNVSTSSLNEFKNKISRGEGESSLFQNTVSLLDILDWTISGVEYSPEQDLLFLAECSEYDFSSYSFVTENKIIISNRDATISAKSDTYGVLFHEAGHILEEMINSDFNDDEYPCHFSKIVDQTNSIFIHNRDRKQFFSETIADIISILLTQKDNHLTYCRMLEVEEDEYKVTPLLPNDVHLGALARILIEARIKKVKFPNACEEILKSSMKLNLNNF